MCATWHTSTGKPRVSATPAAVYGPCAASRIPWDSSMSASTSRLPPIACSRPCACIASAHQLLIDPFNALRWAQCSRIRGTVSPREDTHTVFEVATLECDIPFAHACHQSVGKAGRRRFTPVGRALHCHSGCTRQSSPYLGLGGEGDGGHAAVLQQPPLHQALQQARAHLGCNTFQALTSSSRSHTDDEWNYSTHLQRQSLSQASIVSGNRH